MTKQPPYNVRQILNNPLWVPMAALTLGPHDHITTAALIIFWLKACFSALCILMSKKLIANMSQTKIEKIKRRLRDDTYMGIGIGGTVLASVILAAGGWCFLALVHFILTLLMIYRLKTAVFDTGDTGASDASV